VRLPTTAVLALAGVALVAACASVPDEAMSPPVEAGKRLAEARCAGCHSASPGRSSPHRGAPPFWMLDGLHTPESLQRSVAASGLHSQYGMPSLVLTRGEAAALVAYIEAIGAADAAAARRLDMAPCMGMPC
jgi:mono/diheme cytochrome c family protein